MTINYTILQLKNILFFKSKITTYLYLGFHVKDQGTKEVLSAQKLTSRTSKHEIYLFFPYFLCNFFPSGPDPADQNQSGSGSTTLTFLKIPDLGLHITYMRDGDSLFPPPFTHPAVIDLYIFKKCRRALLLHSVYRLKCLCRDISCFPQ